MFPGYKGHWNSVPPTISLSFSPHAATKPNRPGCKKVEALGNARRLRGAPSFSDAFSKRKATKLIPWH